MNKDLSRLNRENMKSAKAKCVKVNSSGKARFKRAIQKTIVMTVHRILFRFRIEVCGNDLLARYFAYQRLNQSMKAAIKSVRRTTDKR